MHNIQAVKGQEFPLIHTQAGGKLRIPFCSHEPSEAGTVLLYKLTLV